MHVSPNAIVDPATGNIFVQTPLPPITCLALEGGGVRCTAYSGMFRILYDSGLMAGIRHISGSSGGAIGALICALGYSADEVEKIMRDMPMEDFLEGSQSWSITPDFLAKGRQALSVLMSKGHALSTGQAFLKWLQEVVLNKLGNKEATFADLARAIESADQKQKKVPYSYFYVTATNLSLQLPEAKFFSHETMPDMPLALAVRISSSFPFIFEPVLWKGQYYGDGGLMRNLPTKVFDERRFLPDGYDFTDKGVNPAVLTVKIDSQDEIDQVLWGIKKEIKLQTASEFAYACYAALIQNTDTDEVREARMTLALPDKNISVLEFAINDSGKISLISSAEKETQGFLENHVDAAYSMQVYPDKLKWLDSLSLDELDDVILAYQQMKVGPDANHPTKEMLDTYVDALIRYDEYRRLKKRNPECAMNVSLPSFHIDLKLSQASHSWNIFIKEEMKYRLGHVEEKIKYADERMKILRNELVEVPVVTEETLLHVEPLFEYVKLLTALDEFHKMLVNEKNELKLKLGKASQLTGDNKISSDPEYAPFLLKFIAMMNNVSLAWTLRSVVLNEYPVVLHEAGGKEDNVVFRLDLRDKNDRRVYLIAGMLYLQHRKCREISLFKDLYEMAFGKDKMLPKNISSLGTLMDLDGVNLLMAAYQIEELLHYFEKREYPKYPPTLDLDVLFGKSKESIFTKKNTEKSVKQDDYAMTHIIRSSSMFSHGKNDSDFVAERKKKEENPESPDWFFS